MNWRSRAGSIGNLLRVGATVMMLPAPAWAANQGLTLTGMTNGAIVTQNGAFSHTPTTATLITPAMQVTSITGSPPAPTLVFAIGSPNTSALSILVKPVKMCKLSKLKVDSKTTRDVYEWLDQGPTLVSVTGTLYHNNVSTGAGAWRLRLVESGISDIYDPDNSKLPACNSGNLGKLTYTSTKAAFIERRDNASANSGWTTRSSGNYVFWNSEVNSAPEPGTLVMMLTALAALLWMGHRRRLTNEALQ